MSIVTSAVSDQLMRVLDAPAWLAYATVFALVLVEDALFVGFLVPGETLAILGGVAANLGHVSLAAMITVVVVAAVVGDSVGYEVGRHLGPRLLESRPLRRHRDRIVSAQAQLARRGGAAVFAARWTAFL
ncbi:MAG: VTT domain-containing protein, partial [Ornithinibacter sp.]